MSSHYLFAYGTLKSDKPEHALHCPTPLSITPAKALGSLWRLREGYPILQVDPASVLIDASQDPVADWKAATELQKDKTPPHAYSQKWIEGELHEYPLEPHSLGKMDLWENFRPGIKSPYQRRVLWVQDEHGSDHIAWAYVCYSPPNWATLLNQTSW